MSEVSYISGWYCTHEVPTVIHHCAQLRIIKRSTGTALFRTVGSVSHYQELFSYKRLFKTKRHEVMNLAGSLKTQRQLESISKHFPYFPLIMFIIKLLCCQWTGVNESGRAAIWRQSHASGLMRINYCNPLILRALCSRDTSRVFYCTQQIQQNRF